MPKAVANESPLKDGSNTSKPPWTPLSVQQPRIGEKLQAHFTNEQLKEKASKRDKKKEYFTF